ncbi:unnamed protein product [Heterobilharzia americana]|nr:unnamed protein product [Heterobilharzia americana]
MRHFRISSICRELSKRLCRKQGSSDMGNILKYSSSNQSKSEQNSNIGCTTLGIVWKRIKQKSFILISPRM